MIDDDFELDVNELSIAEDEGETTIEATKEKTDVSTDTLQLLLRDVGKYHVLSKDEEVALAIQYRDGDERTSERAKMLLINHNLRMVIAVANRYHHARGVQGILYLDLIQEGMLGLIRAVEKFDHTKGFKFSTYSMWWIRQAITRAIAEKSRTIRIPIHMVEKLNKINRATDELQVEYGREPTIEEIAAKLEVEEEKVTDVIRHTQVPVSLNRPDFDNDDDSAEVGTNLTDATVDSPHDIVTSGISGEILHEALNQLSWRETKILEMLYGLNGTDVMTKTDIGKYFAVTYQRISQLERGILEKLRSNNDLQILRED